MIKGRLGASFHCYAHLASQERELASHRSSHPFSTLQTPVFPQLLLDLAPVLFLPSQPKWGHRRPAPLSLCGRLRPGSQVPAGRD